MSEKNFDDVIVEAMIAAQAILAFHGYGDRVISKIGIADRKNIQNGSQAIESELIMQCCSWDCTITNGGACTCTRWC